MVRDQMFCLIGPPRLHDPKRLLRLAPRLQTLFAGDGRIHYASMVLLPPHPDDTNQQASSLMLEFAVDPGLKPQLLINGLLERGYKTLLVLFKSDWRDAQTLGAIDPRHWLAGFLAQHTDPAAGGFVGPRDREVAQIKAEAQLFKAARAQLPVLKAPASDGLDSASLAADVVTWAKKLPDAKNVAGLAPRSYWRSRGMSQTTRAIRIGIRLWPLGLLAALTLVQMLAAIGVVVLSLLVLVLGADVVLAVPSHFFSDFGRAVQAWSEWVVAATLVMLALSLLAMMLVRSVAVALALMILFTILAVLISAVSALLLPIRLSGLLILALLGVLSLVVAALTMTLVVVLPGLLALLAMPRYLGLLPRLLAVAGFAACAILALHAAGGAALDWGATQGCLSCADLRRPVLPGIFVVDAVVALTTLVLPLMALLLLSLRLGIRFTSMPVKWLDAPRAALPLRRGQQVHPSVDACEAALRGRVNHLISLTDIRRPYALHRFMLAFWLRVVTLIGHGWFVEGRLGHAAGIAFSHWHIVDRGRRLLFCANYSGSFGGYLEEFIAGGSQGANLFWRWTRLLRRAPAAPGHPAVVLEREFPPTRLWVFEGCKHAQWFKAYARDSMLPHLMRFEAYNHNYQDIDRATRLRDAIAQPRDRVADDQMMRALES